MTAVIEWEDPDPENPESVKKYLDEMIDHENAKGNERSAYRAEVYQSVKHALFGSDADEQE